MRQPQPHALRPADLLNQQCWLWGQDVRHPDGDLLLRYGGTKWRRQEDRGSHAYQFSAARGVQITLWGFGAAASGATHGVFLARQGFTPVSMAALAAEPPHLPDGLVRCPAQPVDAPLLTALFRWIAEYERWTHRTLGGAYRAACVERWTLGPRIPADDVIGMWTDLAAQRAVWQRCQRNRTAHPEHRGATQIMAYVDKTIMCRDCGEPFVFTSGEQEFYASKGFTNEPTRCAACRQAKKAANGGGYGGSYGGRGGSSDDGGYNRGGYGYERGSGGYSGGGQREMHTVACSEPGCTKDAVVPFKPRGDKPVYCDDCFRSRKAPTARW